MMQANKLLILAAALSCATARPPARPPDLGGQAVARAAGPIDSILGSLSDRQRVAQLVVPWIPGSYAALDDSLLQVAARWVDSLEIGGLIVSDRKSTRLNSSHVAISYAVFCLKKKTHE